MVASVYGRCDGQRIIFRLNPETGKWDADVPFDQDGEYVVEIWAVDDVGNEAYYATLLFIVDTTKLCIKIKTLNLTVQARKDGIFPEPIKIRRSKYKARVIQSELCRDDWTPLYRRKVRMNRYSARVIRCELCGRF